MSLDTTDSLIIHQKKEWGEILTDFETRNRYVILDSSGKESFLAAEVAGSTLLRLFLKNLRAFTIHVMDTEGEQVFELARPFRFYFHQLEVRDNNGTVLGTIHRRFSILRRIYTVETASGRDTLTLFGPLLHPWTFKIMRGDQELGKITKKWSGLMKESFTDADTFGVRFRKDLNIALKTLLLGAVFLIDFVHFEGRS